MNGSLSILVVRALELAIARAGGDADLFLRTVGVPRALLEKGDARLPAATVHAAITRAGDLMNDPCFSLRVADAIPLGTIDVLDFAVRSSPTVRDALHRVIRYFSLIDDCSELHLEEDGDVARLRVTRKISTSPRVATELLFAVLLSRLRQITGTPCPLREVRFLAKGPVDAAPHVRFFLTNVSFAAGKNELVLDRAWLGTPCLEPDPELAAFVDRHADALVAQIQERTDFLERVRVAVRASAAGAEPPLDVVARRIAISPRTLQRRLEENGTSYKALLEEVRRERAFTLLADPTVGIAAIGSTIGFGDARAFYRAFRRWTGSTPAKVRSEMTQAPPR